MPTRPFRLFGLKLTTKKNCERTSTKINHNVYEFKSFEGYAGGEDFQTLSRNFPLKFQSCDEPAPIRNQMPGRKTDLSLRENIQKDNEFSPELLHLLKQTKNH
jgi:hypothetical protein